MNQTINTLFNKILQLSSGVLLMGGDLKCIIQQSMDRQPASKTLLSRMSGMLKYQSLEIGLYIWRSKFAKGRDFLYYSSRHTSCSRTDYFFTSKTGPVMDWQPVKGCTPPPAHRLLEIGTRLLHLFQMLPIEMRPWDIYLHMFHDNNFETVDQLQTNFHLPTTDFYRYLQLRTYLTTHKEWEKLLKLTPIEMLLIKIQIGNGVRKVISKTYMIYFWS
ncbi:hypothetical protein ATANTOWER_029692 [Ataeniobius toweri]|uniref:Uncharacterized protein n=1 Tax=Ataeniobius toweri TaxID=208326 RepID=A0ABU7AHF6_9TELE|nr:hypothetical protein [Ataeniobius toweri]